MISVDHMPRKRGVARCGTPLWRKCKYVLRVGKEQAQPMTRSGTTFCWVSAQVSLRRMNNVRVQYSCPIMTWLFCHSTATCMDSVKLHVSYKSHGRSMITVSITKSITRIKACRATSSFPRQEELVLLHFARYRTPGV